MLANRRCERFAGQEVGLSISPPMTKEDAALSSGALCMQQVSRTVRSLGRQLFLH